MFTKLELRNETFTAALKRFEDRSRGWEIVGASPNCQGGFPYLRLKNGNGSICNLGFNCRAMDWQWVSVVEKEFNDANFSPDARNFSQDALVKSISTFAQEFELRDALAILEDFFRNSMMTIVFAENCPVDDTMDAFVNNIASAITQAHFLADKKRV